MTDENQTPQVPVPVPPPVVPETPKVEVPIGTIPRIKNFFSSFWQYTTAIAAVIIGILLYWINLKNKKAAALQAQVALVQTQKQADVLEADIKAKMEHQDLLAKEVDDHQKALDALEQKRQNLPKDSLSDQDISDIWNKK